MRNDIKKGNSQRRRDASDSHIGYKTSRQRSAELLMRKRDQGRPCTVWPSCVERLAMHHICGGT